MKKQISRGLVAASALVAAGAARADGFTPDTSVIVAAGVSVAAVGTAVFAVMVGIKVIKWVRRAL
ncbi:major capsid protein [Pelomonas sp. APW6]|uniref:Major capsid protein n=1 Tax=Roseateles subflavus TaxID=3053353 RepID=A0ABT7LR89_9BURK|nr:major capsid protein [Pelomonas sp. APW6]MDL5034660.1 major capsid protein [Pelomonas sp. APW6]